MTSDAPRFDSPFDYLHFRNRLRTGHRFFRTPEDDRFFDVLAHTAKSRIRILNQNSDLARAQLGCAVEIRATMDGDLEIQVENEVPYNLERMKPLPRSRSAGRLQPIGKSVLYLSTAVKTCIAEVRPWVGATVSVARFRTNRRLKIVDCRNDKDFLNLSLDKRHTDAELEANTWSWINRDLAWPVDPSDPHINYLHTQVIGEFLHSQGYDGIAFKSSLDREGTNFALFDLNAADPIVCNLFKVNGVDFKYEKQID